MSFWKTQLVNKEAKPKPEITQSRSKTLNIFEECTLNAVVRRELRTLLDEEYRQRKLVRYEDLDESVEKALTSKLTTLMELNTQDMRERMEQNHQQHEKGTNEQIRVSHGMMMLPSCSNVQEETQPQREWQREHQSLREEQGACISTLKKILVDSETQTISCFQLSDKEDNKTSEPNAVSRTIQKVKNRFAKRIQKLQNEHGERTHNKNSCKRSSSNHNHLVNQTREEQLFSFRPRVERELIPESSAMDQLQDCMEEELPCNVSAIDEFLQNRQCSMKEQMPTTKQWPTVDQLKKNCYSLKREIMENQHSKVENFSNILTLKERMLKNLYSKKEDMPKKKCKMMEHNPKNNCCMAEQLPSRNEQNPNNYCLMKDQVHKNQSSMMAHLPENRWSKENLPKSQWPIVKQMRKNRSTMLETISKRRHLMLDRMAKDKQLRENRDFLEPEHLPNKTKSIGVMEELSKNRRLMVKKLQKNHSKIMKPLLKNPKYDVMKLSQNQQLIGDGLMNNESLLENQFPMEHQQGERVKVVVEKKTFATIKLPKWEADAMLTSQTGDQMMENIYTRFKENQQQCKVHQHNFGGLQQELERKAMENDMKKHLLTHQNDASKQQVSKNIDQNNFQNKNLKSSQQKSHITMNAANLSLVSPPSHSRQHRSQLQTKASSTMFMRKNKRFQGP